MQNHTIQTSAIAAVPPNGVQLCSSPNCGEPAVFAYAWEWGEQGLCCSKHHFELNQAAGQLNRSIQCTPLAAGIAAPLERPERVQLMAKALAAEAELEEAKSRGLELYRQNTSLTQQVQALTTRNRESDAQLRDAKVGFTDMRAELERRQAEAANIHDELSRLRALVPVAGAAELAAEETTRLATELRAATQELQSKDAEIATLKADLQRLGAELEERHTVGGEETTKASGKPKK